MATKRIKDLTTTATKADLVSSRYGVLDTPDITKKLPGNLLGGGGGSGGGGLFQFVPGTTTFSDILSALEEGKMFVLVHELPSGETSENYYIGVTSNTLNSVSRIVLVNVNQTDMTFYSVDNSDKWTGPSSVSIDASGKVAVESGAIAGFLKDVLVSASDMVTLVPNGNRLIVNVNLDYSSDPKLETMNESQVDDATSNYGGYQLNSGYSTLVWDDDTHQSFSWLNAKVYQCMRIADAQGTITKCSVSLCGTLAFTKPAPCFNVGIFDLQGNLLGKSGLQFLGVNFQSGEELCEVGMVEEYEGALDLKRNTRYIVQLWTCGIQLAGLDRSTRYNYVYDYTLRQNLETSTSSTKFLPVDSAMSRAEVIPMVSFGAESIF